MAKNLIHAQHEPGSHIFDWPERGGCYAAAEQLRHAIDYHGKFVVVADISDAHGSFNPEYLYSMNLLPPEFVRVALDSQQFRYRQKGFSAFMSDDTEQTCPRGLLQGGAASSAIFAVALDDLPDHLPTGVATIVQSDNIIIVCRSKVECDAAAEALGRYLRDNPAGAFSPRLEKIWLRDVLCTDEPECASWPHSFEQLGYNFYLDGAGHCQVAPSLPNLVKTAKRVETYYRGLPRNQWPVEDHQTAMQGFLTGFPATSPDAREMIEELSAHHYREQCEEALAFHERASRTADTEDYADVPWDG